MTFTNNDNFCMLPWINISTDVNGSIRPCCKFAQPHSDNEYQMPNMKESNLGNLWNDEKIKRLRQAFIDGKRPKECQSCWNEEKAGIPSFRKEFIRLKNITISDDLDFSSSIVMQPPTTIDLKLNNVCNLKCRICGPQASSTFNKELKQTYNVSLADSSYWMSNKIVGTENENIFKQWLGNIQHLEITGGEPFASVENIEILQLCVDNKASDKISLVINTNGTHYREKFISLLENFKQITIIFSIDDIFERFEYQRYPASWNTVQQNLDKFINLSKKNSNIKLGISCTVSNFNVFYLDEFLNWYSYYAGNIFLLFNILHYPLHQSIKYLPDDVKYLLIEKFKNDKRLVSILNFLSPGFINDDLKFIKFLSEVKRLDFVRQQKFDHVFQGWENILRRFVNDHV